MPTNHHTPLALLCCLLNLIGIAACGFLVFLVLTVISISRAFCLGYFTWRFIELHLLPYLTSYNIAPFLEGRFHRSAPDGVAAHRSTYDQAHHILIYSFGWFLLLRLRESRAAQTKVKEQDVKAMTKAVLQSVEAGLGRRPTFHEMWLERFELAPRERRLDERMGNTEKRLRNEVRLSEKRVRVEVKDTARPLQVEMKGLDRRVWALENRNGAATG